MSRYGMKRPCAKCPFRSDVAPYIRAGRAVEIAAALDRSEFTCHQTTVEGEEDDEGYTDNVDGPNAQHCAGALIMLEREEKPSQMMRICERLKNPDGSRMYDPSALDMDAPVYQSRAEFIEAHREAERAEEKPKRKRIRIKVKLPVLRRQKAVAR